MKRKAIVQIGSVMLVYALVAIVLVLLIAKDIASLKSSPGLSQYFPFLQTGLPYFLVALVFSGIASVIGLTFLGTFARYLSRTFNIYALALLLYFLMSNSGSTQLNALSIYILLLTMVLATYVLFNPMLTSYKQFTLGAILMLLTLVLIGAILQFAIPAISKSQAPANALTFGFIFGGVASLATPLQHGKSPRTKKIGRFFGKGTISFIVLGVIIGIYLFYFRARLIEWNSNAVMIGEWVSVGLIVLCSMLALRSNVGAVTAPMLIEDWQKHKQELGFRTTDDFLQLTEAIDAFSESGTKNELLLFLFQFLSENGVSIESMSPALNELINYQKQPHPRLIFSWDANFLEQEEKQKRKELIKRLIKNLNSDLFRGNSELKKI
jgi:hypothetical protein